jgi:hypothetical protein
MVHFLNNQLFLAKVVIFDNHINKINPDVQEHFSMVNSIDDRLNDRKIIDEMYHNIHKTNHDVSNYIFEENLHSQFDQHPDELVNDQLMDCTKNIKHISTDL